MIKIGYNDSSRHYGFITHYEKPDRVNFCVRILKEEFDNNYFIENNHNIDINKLLELVNLAHSYEYINKMRNFTSNNFICKSCGKKNSFREQINFSQAIELKPNCPNCNNELNFDNLFCYASVDTYYTYYTFNIALEAINVIKNLLDQIQIENIRCLFALVRPPGHHCNNDPNGFCVFNNVYIGAKYAQTIGYEKVLILDVDFHHGDGTQQLIEANPDTNISFVSVHGFGEAIYPGTGDKSNIELNILNIPLEMTQHKESREYLTDEYYQKILNSYVFPFINYSNPDLIIVSLGFDAHKDDLLEGMNISDLTYIYLALKLKELNKPIMFVLEGGYNIKTIARIIPKLINIFK
jgi:acetoin utilization deacetylase AcuC-like enzyme